MRHEISEPMHWRSKSTVSTRHRISWGERRRNPNNGKLPAEAVDAAFATENVNPLADDDSPESPDLVSSLTAQLSLLEAQHEQLTRLLDRAHSQKNSK